MKSADSPDNVCLVESAAPTCCCETGLMTQENVKKPGNMYFHLCVFWSETTQKMVINRSDLTRNTLTSHRHICLFMYPSAWKI